MAVTHLIKKYWTRTSSKNIKDCIANEVPRKQYSPCLKALSLWTLNEKTQTERLNNGNFEVITHYAEDSLDAAPLIIVDCLFDKDGSLLETAQVK